MKFWEGIWCGSEASGSIVICTALMGDMLCGTTKYLDIWNIVMLSLSMLVERASANVALCSLTYLA